MIECLRLFVVIRTGREGILRFIKADESEYLELTYDAASDLIGNCASEATETLLVTSTNELLATLQYYDGSG